MAVTFLKKCKLLSSGISTSFGSFFEVCSNFFFYTKTFFLILVFLFSAFFKGQFLPAQEIGLVLSGGGGKGAYEVGVWKALNEYGIAQKITVISGTSVGGLNAALFSMLKPEEAEKVWLEQVPQKLKKEGQELSISQDGLLQIINSLPLKMLQNNFPEVFVTAVRDKFSLSNLFIKPKIGEGAYRFCLNNRRVDEMRKYLLATSAFPVLCTPVWIDDDEGGHNYSDGGNELVGGDNIPIDPIIDNYPKIKKIIVVYLADKEHVKRRINVKDYDSVEILELYPSINIVGDGFWEGLLDGTANFSYDRIGLLIKTGYSDTVELLERKGLHPVSSYWFE
ncbi:MAG: patatin-like phospholipase family protein [Treponema sp.]|nr:patatin-like phospholipase family protein [Treponema sp.]